MPNSLGTLSPEIITLDCLQFLKKKFPVLTAFSHDFSNDTVKLDQTIVTRVVTPPVVQNYTKAGGYASSSGVTLDVAITINQFKYVALSFYDDEISSTPRNLIQEQVEAAAYSLGKEASDSMCSLMNVTNFPTNVVATGANFTRTVLAAVREKLVSAGARGQLNGLINAIAFQYLGVDPVIMSRFNFPANTGDVNLDEGVISGLAGFNQISEYADLSVINTGVTGFFGSRDAILLAARVPSDPSQYMPGVPLNGTIKNVVDEDSGLSMQYRYHYDMKAGRADMILAWMYGVGVGIAGDAVVTTIS